MGDAMRSLLPSYVVSQATAHCMASYSGADSPYRAKLSKRACRLPSSSSLAWETVTGLWVLKAMGSVNSQAK